MTENIPIWESRKPQAEKIFLKSYIVAYHKLIHTKDKKKNFNVAIEKDYAQGTNDISYN